MNNKGHTGWTLKLKANYINFMNCEEDSTGEYLFKQILISPFVIKTCNEEHIWKIDYL